MERIIFVPWERVSLVIPEKQDFDVMYTAINNVNIIKFLQPIRHNTKETEEKFLNSKLENADSEKFEFLKKMLILCENISIVLLWKYSKVNIKILHN